MLSTPELPTTNRAYDVYYFSVFLLFLLLLFDQSNITERRRLGGLSQTQNAEAVRPAEESIAARGHVYISLAAVSRACLLTRQFGKAPKKPKS